MTNVFHSTLCIAFASTIIVIIIDPQKISFTELLNQLTGQLELIFFLKKQCYFIFFFLVLTRPRFGLGLAKSTWLLKTRGQSGFIRSMSSLV